ncbi:hypothetical protein KI387_044719, partial [Taxus chinensis]
YVYGGGRIVVTLVAMGAKDYGIERTTFWKWLGISNTRGGCVATGIYQTIGVDEVMLWVVGNHIVDAAGITDVADTMVIAGLDPNYEINGKKVDTSSTEVAEDGEKVGVSVRGIDTGMS